MKTIDILYFDACPGWRGAVERIRQVVSEGGLGAQVEVRAIPIETEEDARTHRFVGSPTVRIDGHDLEPAAEDRTSIGLQCRVYDVDGRLEGLPPTGWFRKALGVPDGASAPSPAAAPCCGGATPRE